MTNIPALDLIVFGGYSRAGKDTAAQVLIERFGYQQVNLGSVATEMLLEINPLMTAFDGHMRVSEALDKLGYEKTKATVPEFVALLQDFCAVTRDVDRLFLVKAAMLKIRPIIAGGGQVVLTGVRHPDEVRFLSLLGGLTIWIARTGLEPRNNHRAETCAGPGQYDAIIRNDGTIAGLHDQVLTLLSREEFQR